MSDLGEALNTAFDETVAEQSSAAPVDVHTSSKPSQSSDAEKTTEAVGALESAVRAEPKAEAAPPEDEPTGDVLLDKLSPEQITELKKDPRLKAIYKGLMSSYTPKMQQMAEQQRLWEALNNEGTRQQAVAALARAVGLDLKPTDEPQREQARQVADDISDEWSKVVGPEAAAQLRPLIEKTALAAVNGTLQPLQQATEYLQMDARSRQAEAQVSQFRSVAQKNGWTVTPQVEAKMAELGQQILPANPIESVDAGVKHLERLYRLATADTSEADVEKRILERMNRAAQSAEPARGVPSAGRKPSSGITKEMSFSEAMDVAMQEALSEAGLK